MSKGTVEGWSVSDAEELYDVPRWGLGYFSVNEKGRVSVHPRRNSEQSVDLKELVDRLIDRGLELPMLIRFNDIIRDRIEAIHGAFKHAIETSEYQNDYACVFPIKVNQQRHVVEQIIGHGREFGFGLEAGSKPELLAVVAMTDSRTPIICNGFKDAEFIQMALMAQKMGRTVIPVVEKATELDLILRHSKEVGVRPKIGMRVKLAARGAGRWQASGGYRSKFGLTVREILVALDRLKSLDMADCFNLLHFHLGSQITNIRFIKSALIEAARVYADLSRRGAGLEYLDVGGGLGVDYDGSQTNFESSVNYSLQEYANDVVYHVANVCDDTGVPHPRLISESGRALVAYNSVLVFGVLGVSGLGEGDDPLRHFPDEQQEDLPEPLITLRDTYQLVNVRNLLESYHDAQQALEMALTLFSLGHLPLEQRGAAEMIYWAICRKIRQLVKELDYTPEELQGLDVMLSDTYFCNFSLFQSMPDSWAIKQLFPVMPIHRLDSRPTQHGVLGDITCDSDGKIDQFIDRRDVKRTLPLHKYEGRPYFLGSFLVGAYQEILGDLHNLFGDTHAVHVNITDTGEAELDAVIKGETVTEVLDYVQFNHQQLVAQLQTAVELAVREGRFSHREAGQCLKFYEERLNAYTYLGTSSSSEEQARPESTS